MRAFEVYVNGEKVCTAGVGADGVLTAMVTWGGPTPDGEMLWLNVAGTGVPDGKHVVWLGPGTADLKAGDEVLVRVVDAPAVDPPPPA